MVRVHIWCIEGEYGFEVVEPGNESFTDGFTVEVPESTVAVWEATKDLYTSVQGQLRDFHNKHY